MSQASAAGQAAALVLPMIAAARQGLQAANGVNAALPAAPPLDCFVGLEDFKACCCLGSGKSGGSSCDTVPAALLERCCNHRLHRDCDDSIVRGLPPLAASGSSGRDAPSDSKDAQPRSAPANAGEPCWCVEDEDGLVPLAKLENSPRPRVQPWEEIGMLQTLAESLGNMVSATWNDMSNPKGHEVGHLKRCMLCEAKEARLRVPTTADGFVIQHGRNLFVDDYYIEAVSGVERFLSAPHVSPEEVLQRTEPWEDNLSGFPGNVLHNGSHFLMYYAAARINKEVRLAYAASTNGFNWHKTLLNISFPMNDGGDFCVLHDEFEGDQQYRYKMVYNCKSHNNYGCIATSADGMQWRNHGFKLPRWTDTLPCLYRDTPEYFEVMLRQEYMAPLLWRGIRGVQVLRIPAAEFYRGLRVPNARMRTTVASDWYLDRFGKLEWTRRQIYAQSRVLYEGVYFGLLHIYQWPIVTKLSVDPGFLQQATANAFRDENVWRSFDTLQGYLATSRDGLRFNFQWIYDDQPLQLSGVDNNGEEYYKWVQPAAQFVTVGDHHWLFFTGNPTSHRWRWNTTERFHLAKFPRDRISGLQASSGGAEEAGGMVLTKQLQWVAGTEAVAAVAVNVDIEASGALCKVRVLLEDGRESAILEVSRRDRVDGARVRGQRQGERIVRITDWLDKPPSHGQLVRLRFDLARKAKLYAFGFLSEGDLLRAAAA
eukprot:TRINITY_DN82764_c0_g1_i1.p1 TRINITY_DN82764_c0_g1~~TRINITY_DN82764_c0_g1_i1.p1  ORF type:complete len:710 (+),score=158.49 TRINITY_DN82764_c0_g1_i1:129-2258(+)